MKVETAVKLLIMREDSASENGRSMLQTRPSMFEFTMTSVRHLLTGLHIFIGHQ